MGFCVFGTHKSGHLCICGVEVDDGVDVHNQDHDVEGVNQPKINHFEVGRLLKN